MSHRAELMPNWATNPSPNNKNHQLLQRNLSRSAVQYHFCSIIILKASKYAMLIESESKTHHHTVELRILFSLYFAFHFFFCVEAPDRDKVGRPNESVAFCSDSSREKMWHGGHRNCPKPNAPVELCCQHPSVAPPLMEIPVQRVVIGYETA